MSKLLLTGATGFIGRALVPALLAEDHELILLSRYPERHQKRFPEIRLISSCDELDDETHLDAIINLAGAGIADKRWSESRKTVLMESRLGVTRQLKALVERLQHKPAQVISASAVGYYGAQAEEGLHEASAPVEEFTHELCRAWEESAAEIESQGPKLNIIRLGVVLAADGGILKRLSLPFRLCLGGNLGNGRQVLSWVHRKDVVRAVLFLLAAPENAGIWNLTAPSPATNADFTRILASALRRPAFMPMPGFMVRLLFGEMGDRLLLNGQHVIPLNLNRAGFVFSFETLEDALADIFPGSNKNQKRG